MPQCPSCSCLPLTALVFTHTPFLSFPPSGSNEKDLSARGCQVRYTCEFKHFHQVMQGQFCSFQQRYLCYLLRSIPAWSPDHCRAHSFHPGGPRFCGLSAIFAPGRIIHSCHFRDLQTAHLGSHHNAPLTTLNCLSQAPLKPLIHAPQYPGTKNLRLHLILSDLTGSRKTMQQIISWHGSTMTQLPQWNLLAATKDNFWPLIYKDQHW